MSTFVEWIYGELNQHGWTQAELARRSHITPAALSRILNGDRQPGVDTIVGLTRALNVSADEILRRAGLLPMAADAPPDDRRSTQELIRKIERLSPDDRRYAAELFDRVFPNAQE